MIVCMKLDEIVLALGCIFSIEVETVMTKTIRVVVVRFIILLILDSRADGSSKDGVPCHLVIEMKNRL